MPCGYSAALRCCTAAVGAGLVIGLALSACDAGPLAGTLAPVARAPTARASPTLTPGSAARTPAALSATAPLPRAATPTPTAAPTPAVAPRGDFGDAPDGQSAGYANPRTIGRFPTLFRTLNGAGSGVHITSPGEEMLGRRVTREVDADDPRDDDGRPNLVNGDDGDDGVDGLTVELGAIPLRAQLALTLTVAEGAPSAPRYVNVLIDMTRDGRWARTIDAAPEWALRNWIVVTPPGVTTRVRSEPFLIGDRTSLPDGAWMRVLLTREPIAGDDWDGSGQWTHGEVEDYQLALPSVEATGAAPRPSPAFVLSCPDSVTLGPDTLLGDLVCDLDNFGADGIPDVRFTRMTGTSQVLPTSFPRDNVRAGTRRTVTLAMLRDGLPSSWEYRARAASSRSTVRDGVVVLGLIDQGKTLSFTTSDSALGLYQDDRAKDHFLLASRGPTQGAAAGDIRRVASGRAQVAPNVIEALGRETPMIVAAGFDPAVNAYVALVVEMDGPLPQPESPLALRVGIIFEADDDVRNNWRPRVGDFDLYQGTDQWYELIYNPTLNPVWRLQRRDAASPTTATPTRAVAFVLGGRLIALIPQDEFARAPKDLRYRVTVFSHDPDDPLGTAKPSAADVFPEFGRRLAGYGAAPSG